VQPLGKIANWPNPCVDANAPDVADCRRISFRCCRKLADELEVSTKTIQRDIDFMRDQLGLPIEYDQLHFGFIYTEPVTSFPSIEVSEARACACGSTLVTARS
jgi:proteasome accessory factor B